MLTRFGRCRIPFSRANAPALGGLIYRTGSTDLRAKQFPTFLGQVLHFQSSALSGGFKKEKMGV
jgi:hypothetical protein